MKFITFLLENTIMASQVAHQISSILPNILCKNNQNDLTFTQIIPLSVGDSGSYFMTSIYKIKLKFKGETLSLICKLVSPNDELAEELQQELMFQNELLFYNEYVPELSPMIKNMIPKYYYGDMKGVAGKPCLILEFMEQYSLSESTLFLPSDHIAMAVKSLGEFHGLGYVMKETKSKKFREICDKLIDIRYEEFPRNTEKMLRMNTFSKVCCQRGFKYIPNVDEYSLVIDKYKEIFREVSEIRTVLNLL